MSRRLRNGLLAGVVVALAIGHHAYWYRARERAAAPAPEGLAARVYASTDLPLAVWIPFPHQNLAVAEEAVGDLETWIDAGCRLAGLRPPRVPAFGPFRVPPAREMAVAGTPGGERLVVVAEVYPGVALLARLAGRLAGNPWLAGGDVGFAGRPANVEWQGRAWVVRVGDLPTRAAEAATAGAEGGSAPSSQPPPGASRPGSATPALARVRIGLEELPAPAGEYLLRRTATGLGLGLAEADASAALSRLAVAADPPALFLIRGRSAARGGGAQGLALWSGTASKLDLPAAAVFAAEPARRWQLPVEGLLDLAGRDVKTMTEGVWTLAAYEAKDRKRAASWLAAALDGATVETPPPGRSLLWLRPTELVGLSRKLAALNERLPLLGRAEADRWQDLAIFLTPFGPCGWVGGELRHDPPRVDLRLCPAATP